MRTREKENRNKETKPESTHLATFFAKPKEDFTGGTTVAKTSPTLGGRSGIADTGAPEEAGAGAAEELGTGAAEELGTKATKELNTRDSEEASAGASEEPIPDVWLLQKRSRLKIKTKRRNSMEGEYENNSPPHDEGYFIILFPLGLNQGHQSTR